MTLASLTTFLIVFWLVMVGSAVGSFLNVVVYRLPRGMSLSRPGSHCPKCDHPIRWHDNVPVLAWFRLRGRCRDCHAPIAVRYPTVEAICGLMFLAIGWREIVLGGVNLPLRPALVPDGQIYPSYTDEQLVLTAALHATLTATLLAALLIEWDGQRVPARLFLPIGLAGLVAPVFWPHLHPVAAFGSTQLPLIGLWESLAGAATGGAAAWVFGHLATRHQRPALPAAGASVGAVLGWQSVLPVLLAAMLVAAFARGVSRRSGNGRVGPAFGLFLTTLFWILTWRVLAPLTA